MPSSNYICLGKITAPHGVKGWVKVQSYTENPTDLLTYTLTDSTGQTTYTLHLKGRSTSGLLCSLDGVTDRNAAEALRQTGLYVAREDLPDAADDEIYYTDLIGLEARLPDGTVLGQITAVDNYGAGDLLNIRRPTKAPDLFYPFSAVTVPHIDVEAGYVELDPPEGLLEETS